MTGASMNHQASGPGGRAGADLATSDSGPGTVEYVMVDRTAMLRNLQMARELVATVVDQVRDDQSADHMTVRRLGGAYMMIDQALEGLWP